jgi:ABC-2 type transport system permease protein
LLQELVVTAVLPLSALLVGVWTLGDELEDGTAVYLLAKPLPRWQILLPKMAAAALVTGAVVLSSTAAAGLIALAYQGDLRVLGAFLVGVGLGCIAYTAVFVLMSLVTSRALIAGLTYLFVWETSVTALFEGTRYFSLRQQVLGIADWLSGTSPEVFDAYLGGLLSLVLILVVTVAAAIYAEQRLEQVEVREST